MFASKDLFFTKPSGGYQISRSVRLRSSASAYFNRTLTTPTLGTKWTWSGWVKRGTLGAAQTLFSGQVDVNNWGIIAFLSGDTLSFQQADAGSVTSTVTTTQVFRDPSAWYHIVVLFDSTQATAANRLVMYVNGVQITSYGTATYLAQNTTSRINAAVAHQISRYISAAQYFDGYLTEINFIDGQALTPSSFGQTNSVTGVWQPIKYGGTYGTNGFYLNFSDNSNNTATTIGKDYSGNGNNWTPNNISVTAGVTYDSMLDVPTPYADGGNGRGNYCVWNPINIETSTTISEGNLKFLCSSGASYNTGTGTIAVSSGKWYWELTYTGASGDGSQAGILASTRNLAGLTTSAATGTWSDGYAYSSNGNKVNNGSGSAYGATYTTGDVIGVALDLDAGTLVFYKNNTSQGTAYSSLSGSFVPSVGLFNSDYYQANFGQRPFSYTPPTGYVALNTQNLPTPTISNGANYMAATTYTGTGATRSITNTVNGISFQPDFIWMKNRSNVADHALYDALRTAMLSSNTTAAEVSASNVITYDSNGFTISGGDSRLNANTNTYVGWQWKASGSTVSNTNGSITSTVSANTTAGFSVVTYTNTGSAGTVGHGLGVAPKMIIAKSKASAENWQVYHVSVGNTYNMYLNTTAAQTGPSSTYWNSTSPTSTVFSVGSWANADAHVAYCFAEVAGYSKAFSYTGNGSADGSFVYLGFRPRMVLLKRTDTTGNWYIWDTSRNTYNVVGEELYPNLSNTGSTATDLDLLSNGFKLRNTTADFNANGGNYIGFAWSENPFKLALAR